MNEIATVECQGAPRDLGYDQGVACQAAIAARVQRAGGRGDWLARWRPFVGGATLRELEQAVAVDLRRQFPHLDEQLIGLSRGARVPRTALIHLLTRELGVDGVTAEPSGVGLRMGIQRAAGEGGLLAARVPAQGLLRRVQPDAGFVSLEWTLPWLPGALCGVNQAGLAATVTSLPSPMETTVDCAAPAFLLVQNCLGRFETVENALEWCESRLAGGCAELLFADSQGGLAAVGVNGSGRTRIGPEQGVLAVGGSLPGEARGLTGESGLTAERFAAALGDVADDCARITLDPTSAVLGLGVGGSWKDHPLELEAASATG